MNAAQLASYLAAERFSEIESGIRVLWRLQRVEGVAHVPADEVVDFFVEYSLSHPNRSRLKSRLAQDRRVLRDARNGTLRLRVAAMSDLDAEFSGVFPQPVPASPLVRSLETHAGRLESLQTRQFVSEAISCVRNGAPRAAIIMAWCGAVSVLQEHVLRHCIDRFNQDAVQNGLLKTPATNIEDLRGIAKESQFIEALARISVIDGATKRTLKRALDRRNDVGHPSEVRVSDAAVADHLETLMLNVFERF